MVVIVMGVSGSGKSSVAQALARKLQWEFLDADSFHSPSNVAKMKAGIPLTDEDRAPWLDALRHEIELTLAGAGSLALACSALKQAYRERLLVGSEVKLVYLWGDFELLRQRLRLRSGHFMTEQLLASQFATLEEPADAIKVDIREPVEEIVTQICRELDLR